MNYSKPITTNFLPGSVKKPERDYIQWLDTESSKVIEKPPFQTRKPLYRRYHEVIASNNDKLVVGGFVAIQNAYSDTEVSISKILEILSTLR